MFVDFTLPLSDNFRVMKIEQEEPQAARQARSGKEQVRGKEVPIESVQKISDNAEVGTWSSRTKHRKTIKWMVVKIFPAKGTQKTSSFFNFEPTADRRCDAFLQVIINFNLNFTQASFSLISSPAYPFSASAFGLRTRIMMMGRYYLMRPPLLPLLQISK